MDPEEYEKIFGYLSDKKYPNDIKESEKIKWKLIMVEKFDMYLTYVCFWLLLN